MCRKKTRCSRGFARMAPEPSRTIVMMRRATLALAAAVAVTCRLHKFVRFGRDLHDAASPGTPLFDLRAARELAASGIPSPHASSHLALSASAALAHRVISVFVAVDLEDVCATLVPVASGLCCILAYVLGKEVCSDDGMGLAAAGLFALLPACTAATINFSAQGLGLLPLQLTVLFYVRALRGARLVENAVAIFGCFLLLALTWRPGSIFLAHLLSFHASFVNFRRSSPPHRPTCERPSSSPPSRDRRSRCHRPPNFPPAPRGRPRRPPPPPRAAPPAPGPARPPNQQTKIGAPPG